MSKMPLAILPVVILVIFGCARHPHKNVTDLHFHTVAIDPTLHLLEHPSYLVGIEKARADLVGSVPFGTCSKDSELCLNHGAAYLHDKLEWRETLARRLDDKKRLFVSHVATYEQAADEGATPRWRGRLLYSLYRDGALACAKKPDDPAHTTPICIREGVNALGALKEDLEQRIGRERATHVLLYSTGWNSDQVDSIRRYNLFFDQLTKAALEDGTNTFRPIFIGLTWPADWPELPSHSDIFNKKNDADEVAVTWANYLINQILLPLKAKGVKIVAIGHSFGGRIVTTAANSRDLLPAPVASKINLVVGLQAAFSIKRFGGGTEGDPFRDFSKYADKFVFISSSHDEAGRAGGPFSRAFNAILGEEGMKEAQEGEIKPLFQLIKVDGTGQWVDKPTDGPERALLLDASAVVQNHNDVNNPQVGRLLWATIKTFAR
ncbi:MAG: hypothetical protein HY581_08980 [Nitrospirae bacterium]|nr:hypothetical protein [Nitrospirota bacterium]